MKYFKVIFIPEGRKDKEWMVWQASSISDLKKFFSAGSIIDISEITKRQYEEYTEDI